MRRDRFTNGATYEEIIEMSVKSKNMQYDILPSDEPYRAEDFKTLQEFSAVLFKDDYQEKKTEVQCSVFSGFNKGSERIVTINRFHGNIIEVSII